VVGHETGTGLATVWSGPRSWVDPGQIGPNGPFQNSTQMCLDGKDISVKITLFGLVVDNSVRLVISREI
jgi:hypothetical protein